MKRQQVEVMNSIDKIQKKQALLLQKIRSVQQQIFQMFGQRYLLKQKMMHRHLEQVLDFLPGTFAHNALYTSYLSVCLEMKVQLNPDDHPFLKKLIEWSDMFPSLRQKQILPIIEIVSPAQTISSFTCFEEYIVYLNFIGADLLKLIRRSKIDEDKIDRINLSHIEADDLIQFLLNSLPKNLFNIILPVDVLPPQFRESKSMQILYRATDLEFFMKSSPNYLTLMKILVKILIKLDLKPAQQKLMMEVVFRYFYCYHHDKKYGSTDIFIEAYNALHESVRYAMADEFVLFFRVIRKIGKSKFCDFLLTKSQWLKQIDQKVSKGNFVGYAKEALNPFANLKVWDTFIVPNGKIQYRTLQVLQDFSLFYFVIDIPNYDITIRLNYMGDFNDSKPSCVQLLNYQKRKGVLKANIMAAKKGIYQFEFDNSYSWMNSKTIKMEKLVLMPLEFSSPDTLTWVSNYYDGITLNQVADKSTINEITKREPPKEKTKYDGVANITRNGTFFNMKISRGTGIYEFESESEQKLLKKFNQIVDLGTKIKWMVAGEELIKPDEIEEKIKISKDVPQQNETEKQVQPQVKVEKEVEPEQKPEQLPIKKESKKEEQPPKKEETSPKQKKKTSQKKAKE